MSAAPAITGVGRAELLAQLDALRTELAAVYENLTATQARCTELLLETRAQRQRMLTASEWMLALEQRLAHARAKHPGGPDLRSLVEELGEVANALRRETADRVKDELLDVATVAIRLWLGEGAP